MRVYIDTSVLTAAYCPEKGSARAEQALRESAPMISSLTRLEFSSAVAKKLRAKTLPRADATRIVTQFQEHIRDGIFELAPVRESHYALACDWMDSFVTALRTLDALHLALAFSNEVPLVTADSVLAKSARTLGITVQRL